MRLSLALSAAALLVSTAACSTDSPMSPTSPLAAKNSGGSCQQVYGNLVHTIQLASATDNYQIESGTFLEFMLGGQSLLPGQTAAT